jgi:hypothetical protein
MTFDNFKKIVDSMIESSKKIDKTYSAGIDVLEFVEPYNSTIRLLWSVILTEQGLDWFEWFMYEKNYVHDGVGDPEMQAFYQHNDEEEVEIAKDLQGLYDYLVENNYFTCESQK